MWVWASRGLGTAERGGAQMEQLFQRERTLWCFTGDVTWGVIGCLGAFSTYPTCPLAGKTTLGFIKPQTFLVHIHLLALSAASYIFLMASFLCSPPTASLSSGLQRDRHLQLPRWSHQLLHLSLGHLFTSSWSSYSPSSPPSCPRRILSPPAWTRASIFQIWAICHDPPSTLIKINLWQQQSIGN